MLTMYESSQSGIVELTPTAIRAQTKSMTKAMKSKTDDAELTLDPAPPGCCGTFWPIGDSGTSKRTQNVLDNDSTTMQALVAPEQQPHDAGDTTIEAPQDTFAL